MIVVHVWDSAWGRYVVPGAKGSPGHAAIQLSLVGLSAETGYASLHPSSQGIGKGRLFRSFPEDVAMYQKKKQAHWHCAIGGLDERKMWSAWESFRKSSTPYSTKNFCSSLVHDILIAGDADKYAKGLGSWALFAWSPADVKDFTQAVLRGLAR